MPPSPSRASRCARCASPCRSWRGPASNARPGRGSVGAGVRVIDVAQRALFRLARTSGVGTGGAREGEGEGAQHQEERSEEHTSELQSPCNLVCRLLLEKKKNIKTHKRKTRASYRTHL